MVHMPHWPMPPWHTIKFGLEAITNLLSLLGDPHLKLPPVIHVAGTNGKGSTIAFLRAILEQAGLRVHVYTSPHLIEFNERIVLASEKIDDQYLFDVHERTRVAAELGGLTPTFFEGTTAAAFLAFSEVEADIMLLETGMGGRLDATNVVPQPLLTVITTIAHDHMDYLGSTLPIIAGEKAGIIKAGVPCIISCQVDEVYDVLFAKCEEMQAPITAFGCDFGIEVNEDCFRVLGFGMDDTPLPHPSLCGDHQLLNASTAIAAISLIRNHFGINNNHIKEGLGKTYWPARLQKINDNLWVDGAHNSNGAQVLSIFCLEELQRPLSLILGLTKNRNAIDFLTHFQEVADHVFCVQVRSEASSYTGARLAELAAPAGIPVTACESLEEAMELATQKKGVTVVTGSLFLAADLFKLLNRPV